MITEEGYDLVSGWKRNATAPSQNASTKLFNATVRKFSGIKLHDFNCGLKAYRQSVVKHIEVYNDMHRFCPIWQSRQATLEGIGEKVVQHYPRKYGTTKFGISRFVNGYLDLLVLWFYDKVWQKADCFFWPWGSVMFVVGFIALVVILVHKFIALQKGVPARLVADLPPFTSAWSVFCLACNSFLAGFVGELLARQAANRNTYNIREEIR